MRTRRRSVGLLALSLVATRGPGLGAEPTPRPGTEVEYGQVDAATVRVFAVGTVGVATFTIDGRPVKVATPEAGFGTGFVVDSGLVVTAHHVVAGARHIVVRLPGEGGFYAASLVHENKEGDVAVLALEATPPVLVLAGAAALHVRQTVFAVGYPLDPRRTQAQSARGIVAGQTEAGAIQLDMALNPGNSGGPLLDEQNQVVGMVVARGDPGQGVQGIGFAVPAARLAADLAEARRRLDAGQVPAMTAQQRLSAVVVDELLQRGVFHEIRAAADLRGELRSSDVQAALDSLAGRIEDPDLLVFVGGHLWNVSMALAWADEEALVKAGLTRERARDLSDRFGRVMF